jgi:hypothetical protein
MDLLFGPIMACVAQGCCWYTIFQWCGCIQEEREIIHTQQPVVVVQSNNPFKNPNAPNDAHLIPAYR